ncbi:MULTISPECIES: hypothetical protein [unclassified Aliivibrio]|jgi:hypothetical protein|uniref:hypothetical protein n=1 Tax=unclassified Aliivibrio TaxID=2645654 RepID=UPI00080E58AA|nr:MULTISPECIES: hypothetical protein [unclassified Aliivibrio]OCH12772.1 hypothetical protein A6E05_06415 [Aliivibrio sp. 1S165]OCH16356.1 hypothetical protein A6E03_12990 [Aliivibrio sp. 1S128]OCH28540.1 hypothetical protein A6E06_09020 [Aliivibrio sp. 1S175]
MSYANCCITAFEQYIFSSFGAFMLTKVKKWPSGPISDANYNSQIKPQQSSLFETELKKVHQLELRQ